MHAKFVQISTVVLNSSVVLYALDENGNIYEKIVGAANAVWTRIQ